MTLTLRREFILFFNENMHVIVELFQGGNSASPGSVNGQHERANHGSMTRRVATTHSHGKAPKQSAIPSFHVDFN